MSYLLIVANTPSDNTQRFFDAVVKGAQTSAYEIKAIKPFDATAQDVLDASGIILGTTENFGYMSGQVKDFLERIYYPCIEKKQGMPWALYISAGQDGTGAIKSVEKIVSGMKWRKVQDALVLKGPFEDCFLNSCEELGAGMASGLELKVF